MLARTGISKNHSYAKRFKTLYCCYFFTTATSASYKVNNYPVSEYWVKCCAERFSVKLQISFWFGNLAVFTDGKATNMYSRYFKAAVETEDELYFVKAWKVKSLQFSLYCCPFCASPSKLDLLKCDIKGATYALQLPQGMDHLIFEGGLGNYQKKFLHSKSREKIHAQCTHLCTPFYSGRILLG